MKKLFLLLTAVLLSAGMVVQAATITVASNNTTQGSAYIDQNDANSGTTSANISWNSYANCRAVPNNGYKFSYWQVSGSSTKYYDNPYSYKVGSSNKTITAYFTSQSQPTEIVETNTVAVAYADYRKISGYNLFQLQIYVDTPEKLAILVAGKPNSPYTDMQVSNNFDTNNSSIWTYTSLPTAAGQRTGAGTGKKVVGLPQVTGTITRIYENSYGDFYYYDLYVYGGGAYNKIYHVTGYNKDQKGQDAGNNTIGTLKSTHNDDDVDNVYANTADGLQTDLVGGNTYLTFVKEVGTMVNAAVLKFNYSQSYVSTGKYEINNSGNSNSIAIANGSLGDETGAYLCNNVNNGWDYAWFPMCGNCVVINPNHWNQPIYASLKFGTTVFTKVAYYATQTAIYNTLPSKSQFSVTADSHGSASFTCVEGHGYANSNPLDFTTGGDYYYDNTETTVTATNSVAGYHFDHWTWNGNTFSDNDANPMTWYVAAEDAGGDGYTRLQAVFAANTYNVRFNANGGGSSMSNQSHTYGQSKDLTANAFTAPSGKEFAGWATSQANANAGTVAYTDEQSVTNLTSTNNATVDLYAVWVTAGPTTYTLNLNAGAYGTVTVYNDTKGEEVTFTNNEAEIEYEDEIVITYLPTAGYHVGTHTFSGQGNFNSGDGFFMDGPHAITVTFEPDVYTITYNENGGTTVDDGSYNVESATITLPTTSEKTGYTFGGWYTNSGLTGDAVTTIPTGSTGNKEYWAKWNTVSYTITYNENGGSTVADGSYNIESAPVTLPTTS